MKEMFQSGVNILFSPQKELSKEKTIEKFPAVKFFFTLLVLRFIFSTLAYILISLNSSQTIDFPVLIFSAFTTIIYLIIAYYSWIIALFAILKIADKKVTFKEATQYLIISRIPSLIVGVLPFSFFFGFVNMWSLLIFILETYLFVVLFKTVFKSTTLKAIGFYLASGFISAFIIDIFEVPFNYIIDYISVFLF